MLIQSSIFQTGSERLIWAQGAPSTLRAVSTTIRGTRINLAAAVCWENYMPLVRQTLYAQNVNLYLAPTADNRDAWLGLVRTIGVEGRCFVVSSNMCVKGEDKPASSAGARSAALRESTTAVQEEEEGFEIAAPRSPTKHKRRKSVFDEDGNEIVLGCDADSSENNDTTAKAPEKKTNGATTTSAASASKTSWISRGGSSIVNPYGDVIAGPQWEDPDGLIYADVDFRECIKGRLDLDAGGSYSRSDSFKFSVEGLDLDPLPY